MHRQIITQDNNFPIQPSHIHIGEGFMHFWNAFGQHETEVSAYFVVKLCQELGGWVPFTREQIEELYNRGGNKHFTFNQLIKPGNKVLNGAEVFGGGIPRTEPAGGGWIVLHEDGKHYLTDDFIMRCFQSSPATRHKAVA